MPLRPVILGAALALTGLAAPVLAESPAGHEQALKTSYGLSQEEASGVLSTLAQAQADLRAGRKLRFPFTLTSGTSILSEAVDTSPRDAFLALDSATIWKVARDKSVNSVLRVYDLSGKVAPESNRYWAIKVWINGSGDIERVDMLHEIPPPF